MGYIQGRLPKTISARNRKAEPTTTTTAHTTHNPVFRGALCLPAFLPVGELARDYWKNMLLNAYVGVRVSVKVWNVVC